MKKMKQALALLMALSMVFALAACGGSTESVAENVSSQPEISQAPEEPSAEPEVPSVVEESVVEPEPEPLVIEYPLFDEPQTYTIWMGTAPDLTDVVKQMDQFVVFRELEKVTNVTWNATMVSFMAESEQFQLMVAGEDYTDVVCKAVDNYTGTMDQAIEQDFLIDLSKYIPDNMPNLTGWFEKYPELKKQITSDEGAIVSFPKMYKEPSDISSGGMIRADWLEDLGLDNPKTFDELDNVLSEFKEKKGAATPLVIAASSGVQSELISGYNINSGFYQVDGQIRFGAIQPEFKEYLTMMNKWYSAGMVDDSFLSNQFESLIDQSAVLNGACGVWYGTAAQMIPTILGSSADPDMRITGITTVTKDGAQAHVGESGTVFDSHLWSVTTVCQDPDVICRYIDYIYGEDGILLANYGVENETFTYVDGVPRLTDLVLNNPDYSYGAAMNMFVCDRMTPVPFVIDEARVRADYIEDQINAVEIWNASNDGLYNLPRSGINLTIEESEEYNTKYSDIETYMDENVVKFVVGDKSLDEFDDYVATMKQMGIEDCVAIEQAAYDRYIAE